MEEISVHEQFQLELLDKRKLELLLAGYHPDDVEIMADLEMNIGAPDLSHEERTQFCAKYNQLIERAKGRQHVV